MQLLSAVIVMTVMRYPVTYATSTRHLGELPASRLRRHGLDKDFSYFHHPHPQPPSHFNYFGNLFWNEQPEYWPRPHQPKPFYQPPHHIQPPQHYPTFPPYEDPNLDSPGPDPEPVANEVSDDEEPSSEPTAILGKPVIVPQVTISPDQIIFRDELTDTARQRISTEYWPRPHQPKPFYQPPHHIQPPQHYPTFPPYEDPNLDSPGPDPEPVANEVSDDEEPSSEPTSILGKPVIVPQVTISPDQIIFKDELTDTARQRQCVQDCPSSSEYGPVCGTNDVTYFNAGKFKCARSCGVVVYIKHSGRCPSSISQWNRL